VHVREGERKGVRGRRREGGREREKEGGTHRGDMARGRARGRERRRAGERFSARAIRTTRTANICTSTYTHGNTRTRTGCWGKLFSDISMNR